MKTVNFFFFLIRFFPYCCLSTVRLILPRSVSLFTQTVNWFERVCIFVLYVCVRARVRVCVCVCMICSPNFIPNICLSFRFSLIVYQFQQIKWINVEEIWINVNLDFSGINVKHFFSSYLPLFVHFGFCSQLNVCAYAFEYPCRWYAYHCHCSIMCVIVSVIFLQAILCRILGLQRNGKMAAYKSHLTQHSDPMFSAKFETLFLFIDDSRTYSVFIDNTWMKLI